MDKTSLGDRMKNNYENVNRFYLTRRMPVHGKRQAVSDRW